MGKTTAKQQQIEKTFAFLKECPFFSEAVYEAERAKYYFRCRSNLAYYSYAIIIPFSYEEELKSTAFSSRFGNLNREDYRSWFLELETKASEIYKKRGLLRKLI